MSGTSGECPEGTKTKKEDFTSGNLFDVASWIPWPAAPPKKRPILPALSVAVLLCALIGATTVIGLPHWDSHEGDWLGADGQRILFAAPESDSFAFAEWSRPGPGDLLKSDLFAYPLWVGITDAEWVSLTYARLRMILTGKDGETTGVIDQLWTQADDGGRTVIEFDAVVDADEFSLAIYLPGRLDLPATLAPGSRWASEGTAITWDADLEEFIDQPYQAQYGATESKDPELSQQGCVEIAMGLKIGTQSSGVVRTWCPGQGIAAFSSRGATWTPTTTGPPARVAPEIPFDWSRAESLNFHPLIFPDLPFLDPLTPVTIASPGRIPGAVVLTEQLPPQATSFTTSGDPHVEWSVRPGGVPTTSTTLGDLILIATTNRTLVAYSEQGRWVWESPLSDLSVVPPIRWADHAIVVTLDGRVTAIDLRTGATIWSTSLGTETRFPPVLAGDLLLVANQGGGLACLDRFGTVHWVIDAGVPSSMAVSQGEDPVVVFSLESSAVIRAYSLADGHQVWRARAYLTAYDMVGLDKVVVLRDDKVVVGLDWESGQEIWRWAGERTATAAGGGDSLLLLGESQFILVDGQGRQVRTWGHSLVDVSHIRSHLVISGDTVLAYSSSRFEVGVLS